MLAAALTLASMPQMRQETDAAPKNPIDKKEYIVGFSSDISLKGSGDGYHAKIVFCNNFSLGVQYDNIAVAPYAGKQAVLVENIARPLSTGPQTVNSYIHPGFTMPAGEKHNYAFGITRTGRIDCFYDKKKFASYQNDHILDGKETRHYPHLEAIAKHEGDTVDATFENVVYKFGNYLTNDKKTPVRYPLTDDPRDYLERVPEEKRVHYLFFNDESGFAYSGMAGYTEEEDFGTGPVNPDDYANSDKITLLSKRNQNGVVENVRIQKTQHFDEHEYSKGSVPDWDSNPYIGAYYGYWSDLQFLGTNRIDRHVLHDSWDGWDGYLSHAPLWKKPEWDWKDIYVNWHGK